MKGVSVIICCYNSSNRITTTLEYLANQSVASSISWEVIVVNNASTDNTREVAQSHCIGSAVNPSFRIVDQPIPGLTAARQKGIEVSIYDILIFCDDDNHFEPTYVQDAYELMLRNSQIGIAGGWVKPRLPFYPGKWIEQNYAALAIGKQSDHNQFVEWVFGAGMILRKKFFDDLKSRKIKLLLSDRKGANQSSGGDAELCQLAKFIGYKVYFSPNLILFHQIDGKRLTKQSFIKSNFQNLHATVHLYLLEKLISDGNLTLRKIKLSLLRTRCSRILNAIPRLLSGRHSFLNFLEIGVGSVLISWILLHGSEIKKSFVEIKQNLDNGRF